MAQGRTRFYTLRDVHKDVAYYTSELAAVQDSLKRWLDEMNGHSAGENIPAARTLLAGANKLQQEMQSLELSISRNRRMSWVLNFGRRRRLMRSAERQIGATRRKLRDFSALCGGTGGVIPDLGKPQKFEALKMIEEGGRSIIDLFQKRKLNLIGVVGPADVGKMAVVKEVERVIGKDPKFRHHVVCVDLGVHCDSIEKAQRKIGNALRILQFPKLDPSGRDHQTALDLLVNLNVREEILVRAKILLKNRTSTNAIMDPDGAAEKLLKTLNATKDLMRAGQLMRKLIALEPTLVILNDVWFSLEYLELVGIPRRKGCRVMVVSHSRGVCKEMKCQAIVELQELAPTAGDPLSVLNIEMGIVRNIKGYNDFSHVFEHLTHDAKSILFLCCLFAPGQEISIEELTRFSVAAQILLLPNDDDDDDDDHSFQAAWEQIQEILTELSDSHLLSYVNEQPLVLMIPDAAHTCTRRMLALNHPGDLKSFLLAASGDIDHTFFEKLNHVSLRLLTLRGNIQSLQGIQSLSRNLKALHMEHCKLLNRNNNDNHDLIKLIGQLTKLEILSFRGSDIQHLPMELRGLKNLKLLDLSDCTDLQRIPAKLIPNWHNLEDLYITDFKNWSEHLDVIIWKSSASIREVVDFPCLVTLFLTATINQLPSNFSFSTKLKRYQIVIKGSTNHTEVVRYEAYPIPRESSSAISISSFPVQPLHGNLFDKLEYLNLKDITGLRSIIRDWSLAALKSLIIEDCRDLEYLFEETATSGILLNLQTLELINLKNFKGLMKGSDGLDLCHLETLIIKHCIQLEQIFWWEQPCIQLPQVQTIELKNLSKLTRICSKGTSSIAMPILRKLRVEACPNLESSDVMLLSTPVQTNELKNPSKLTRIWSNRTSSVAMPILRKLCVEGCPNLESSDVMLPSTQAQQMPATTLETLILAGEFRKRAEKPRDLSIGEFTPFKFRPGYLYTNLKHLELLGLPLEQLWKDHTQIIGLQTLSDLRVINCTELRCIFTAAICRNMPQLKNLKISGCHKLEQIIEEDEMFSSSDAQRISCFPNLTDLEISGCPKLTTIFPINITHFPNLKTLSIESSEKLASVFQAKLIPDHDTSKKEILQLPQLHEVKLKRLHKLESFSPQGFEFTFSSLKEPEVKDCPLIRDSFKSLKGVLQEESTASFDDPQPFNNSNHTSDFSI